MPNLDDLKKRIGSVKSTEKITKAMKMVAAAKLRRAQESAESSRPYSDSMKDLIESISKGYKPSSTDRNLLTGDEKDQIHLLILFTSERGLCGGFNSIVTRTLRDKIENLIDQNKTVKIVCVGKKGYDILKRQYSEMITEVIDMRAVKSITYQDAKNISDKIVKMFFDGEFDKCSIFYNEFKSVISQIPTEQQVIPIEIINDEADEEKKEESFFEFEPGESEILDEILPLNFTVQVFKALLESAASEQGARMSAMDNASRNAGDMIDNLTLFYNRSRQAVITKELIEIISGAEAV
ncbi:F0F1 ATP synthase subunit gamma [Pelagibacteraceae bacterium]|jgi:F-type H+-transporting ATPase subunit gamma|nr:F0F1 ATP synthase subunit gamma [Pelagibacterales bacterium SAG-MED38]MBD1141675.1 F0F1 ATP synthase subunit gamma [Pelagibacterales bacterium SAG-MED32]MDC3223103.1 F0F1 ATP synthase subunit gamma [Pelagibacteraceae bacterium]|tara:strand:+ start:26 stop:910 length:885 start_codon:yes stop_codon:yes gene_type:complete